MSETMFEQLIEKPRPTRKWLLFPVSLLMHVLLIAAVVVAPYLNADSELPKLVYVDVMLSFAPPPPQPPVVGKAGKKNKARAEKKKERKEKPKVKNETFVAPIEIPSEIEEEDLEDLLGDLGGDGHNIEGAAEIEGLGQVDMSNLLVNRDGPGSPNAAPVAVVTIPKLIKRVAPQYPTTARRAHIQGTVEVRAITDVYGRVIKASIVRGHPLLTSAALQAVRQWIYEPFIINGIPKPVTFIARVIFTLQR
jgi:TonB family protein